MKTNKYFTLANGLQIPLPGFGTWQIPNGPETYDSVSHALTVGYRHIDTANAYKNEESVGKAVRDSGINRAEIFVTTKLPAEIKTYEGAISSFEDSINNLGLDYIDLYIIHAPWPWEKMGEDFSKENVEVWKALEEIYASGRARAIGVSNFEVKDLEVLLANSSVKPMSNQIKFFIGHTQENIVTFCEQNNILVEGFSPLATGEILKNESVVAIAKKYGKSVAQLSIQYVVQRGVIPLPKSTTPERIKQNIEIDFEISEEDMAYLNDLKNTVEKMHGPKK